MPPHKVGRGGGGGGGAECHCTRGGKGNRVPLQRRGGGGGGGGGGSGGTPPAVGYPYITYLNRRVVGCGHLVDMLCVWHLHTSLGNLVIRL